MILLAEAFAFVQDRINQGVQAGDPIDPKWTSLRDRLYAASIAELSATEVAPPPTPVLPKLQQDNDPPGHAEAVARIIVSDWSD
jgi:hypothetical protein